MGQVTRENKPILGKHEHLLKFFLKSKKGRWAVKIDYFLHFRMGQVTHESKPLLGKH